MTMTPEAPTVRVLAKGVTLDRLMPGGKEGPDGVVTKSDQPGGGLWTESFHLGGVGDPWRLVIPDIRMAPNQIWPMHWHDCWSGVLVIDGSVMVGDWWMQRGDLLITPASAEYGPLLNGPKGCQLLEFFAQDVLAPGGYAPDYHDHPTLRYLQKKKGNEAKILPRPKGSEHNAGSSTTPLGTIPGLVTTHLAGGQRFDFGAADDPERGVILDTKLPAGVVIPEHHHRDWRGFLVWDGWLQVGGEMLTPDDLLIMEPGAEVGPFEVGPSGVHLLELARTSAAVPVIFSETDRSDPRYREGFAAISDATFE